MKMLTTNNNNPLRINVPFHNHASLLAPTANPTAIQIGGVPSEGAARPVDTKYATWPIALPRIAEAPIVSTGTTSA